MKKLSKKCGVQLFVKNTSVVIDTDYLHNEVRNELYGTKNYVMSKIREILIKYHGFTGKLLTDTLDAINKTSRVYKSVGEGVYETVIHAFNPTTKKLYTFKVKYDVKRMSNLPSKRKINNMGENLYEKRLVQLYGGGNLGRYRLAIKNVNIYKLLELLSPMISVQFKNAASIRITKESITEALKVADQFDEICKIVKNAYSL